MTTDSAESTESVETGSEKESVDFYRAQVGIRGRDGGPYLDDVEREAGEVRRAKVEGREPNFDDQLPPVAGTVLVPGGQLVDNVWSNPSMVNQRVDHGPVAVDEEVVWHETLEIDTRTVAPDDSDNTDSPREVESSDSNSNSTQTVYP